MEHSNYIRDNTKNDVSHTTMCAIRKGVQGYRVCFSIIEGEINGIIRKRKTAKLISTFGAEGSLHCTGGVTDMLQLLVAKKRASKTGKSFLYGANEPAFAAPATMNLEWLHAHLGHSGARGTRKAAEHPSK